MFKMLHRFEHVQNVASLMQHVARCCIVVQQTCQTNATFNTTFDATMLHECCMKCCIRLTSALYNELFEDVSDRVTKYSNFELTSVNTKILFHLNIEKTGVALEKNY